MNVTSIVDGLCSAEHGVHDGVVGAATCVIGALATTPAIKRRTGAGRQLATNNCQGSSAMNDNEAELAVQRLLEARGFDCQRYRKADRRLSKTPDYRVSRDGVFRFYAEVKSLHGEDPLDLALNGVDEFQIATIFRNDPVFNRITTAVHKAVSQFDAVNPERIYPNVLALVNFDEISSIADLIAVLTGKFIADDGTQDVIYRKYAGGRMSTDAGRVDLYLWLHSSGEPHFIHTEGSIHQPVLAQLFGTDLSKVRRL